MCGVISEGYFQIFTSALMKIAAIIKHAKGILVYK